MKRTSASDLVSAVETIHERFEKWNKEHPNEKTPVCPYCQNSGLITKTYNEMYQEDSDGVYEYYEPCPCVNERENLMVKNNQKFAGVPELFKDATFKNFKTDIYKQLTSKQIVTIAKQIAMNFVESFEKCEKQGMGLYIYSRARGSGKTRLASTISNELTKIGVRNKFSYANDIINEITATWKDRDQSEMEIIKNYAEPSVLIIDELGVKSGQSWIDEKFLTLIDKRYAGNKVTIITSNYEINRLPFNDSRIIDRLSDSERFCPVEMPNESLRGGKSDPRKAFWDLTSNKKENEGKDK